MNAINRIEGNGMVGMIFREPREGENEGGREGKKGHTQKRRPLKRDEREAGKEKMAKKEE